MKNRDRESWGDFRRVKCNLITNYNGDPPDSRRPYNINKFSFFTARIFGFVSFLLIISLSHGQQGFHFSYPSFSENKNMAWLF